MNIGWFVLIGCFSVIEVLARGNGNGRDCNRWGGCEEGPGDPGGGGEDTKLNPQPSGNSSEPDRNEYDDCQPWQTSTPGGCRNCSGVSDECNVYVKCCDELFCGNDGFCACNDGSADCGHEDDDDRPDDGTLLEAAKIALAVAVVIAAVAAGMLVWRTCSKQRRRRRESSHWQAQRRTRQHSSLTSAQQYVLSRLCDRPPRYEDECYVQEEKPPPYDVAVATIPTPMSTAFLLANSAPFRSLHAENAAYVEDETERPPAAVETGVQLCPACLCHRADSACHAAAAETVQSDTDPPRQACRTAHVKSTPQCTQACSEHPRSRERERHSCGCNTACCVPEQHKHTRTQSHS